MLILRPEEVEGLLTITEAIDAVEKAFGDDSVVDSAGYDEGWHPAANV